MARPSTVPPRRARRWPWVLFVLLLVVPTLEIGVIVGVGNLIGFWPTLILLVLESALGAWLVKREGRAAWTALTTALRTGRMPAGELADAALVLVGGTLLLTPGFLSDVVGFFFMLPMTRPIARGVLAAVIERRLLGGLFGVPLVGVPVSAPRGADPQWRQTAAGERVAPGEVIEGEIIG